MDNATDVTAAAMAAHAPTRPSLPSLSVVLPRDISSGQMSVFALVDDDLRAMVATLGLAARRAGPLPLIAVADAIRERLPPGSSEGRSTHTNPTQSPAGVGSVLHLGGWRKVLPWMRWNSDGTG
jgi:hypothetical protein